MSKLQNPLSDQQGKTNTLENRSLGKEELYRLLIEGVGDYAIFMLDKRGHIITWNKGAEQIKGYKADEIIGKHFSIFYPSEAKEMNYPQFELTKALAEGKFEDEGWRIRKDGTHIWANVIITAVYNKQGKHIGFSKVTRDLSERRKNEELMLKNKELLRINTDLDNFVYTASHDLKAPVVNLEGLIEALKEDLGENKHEDILNRIASSINRLKNVINDLTDVARLQDASAGKEEVLVGELFEEVKKDLEFAIAKSKANIVSDFKDYSLSKYPRNNLRSILYNLLSNAIKYTTPGRAPEIAVKLEKILPDQLVLSVTDNGLGMSESQRLKVFQMYRRMHTHVEGSGLGLYIVKRMLENNGDRIEVQSEEGKGSTFQVFFKV
ncbi:PAS domain S-box protein [Pontibacter sp. BT310]|uniref:histidine kinase n=1 Tax=Pontibacter populi TaxID=890055 RepID=A0ABS6X6U6_9BACT|nr:MULTISPECIES: PAS domain-containing sensor histidine kinase [Pontibacter]MBJ6116748.1 PAS domain S-box protein [Pontibacter sp. BT310]MBR0569171.1 PAS domain S-box protein [Microvirga sp. STS03]MBW3363602.1 PAS domain-containing sensor histidine kinase [Pontibacter populi]